MRVYSPYTLLSITKITGSFQIAAKFNDSWNAPIFVAASPNSATPTFFFFCIWIFYISFFCMIFGISFFSEVFDFLLFLA